MRPERTVGSELLLNVLQRRTQREGAKEVGVSQSILSRWASGQTMPSFSSKASLQTVYGIPIAAWKVPVCIKGNHRAAIVELVETVKTLELIVERMLLEPSA